MDQKNPESRELNQEEMDKASGGSGYSRSIARGLRKYKPKIGVPEAEPRDQDDGGHSGGATGGW